MLSSYSGTGEAEPLGAAGEAAHAYRTNVVYPIGITYGPVGII